MVLALWLSQFAALSVFAKKKKCCVNEAVRTFSFGIMYPSLVVLLYHFDFTLFLLIMILFFLRVHIILSYFSIKIFKVLSDISISLYKMSISIEIIIIKKNVSESNLLYFDFKFIKPLLFNWVSFKFKLLCLIFLRTMLFYQQMLIQKLSLSINNFFHIYISDC